ncbi:MAG: hypothetical protein HW374_1722 [Bacteroidetes bacterium]|nr:hypothetical protein [Bacteroidota bacterium]
MMVRGRFEKNNSGMAWQFSVESSGFIPFRKTVCQEFVGRWKDVHILPN